MTDAGNVADFESMYADVERTAGVIPYDIDGPQPVVEQLVAYGALRGEVLDPDTGDGHHAIRFERDSCRAPGRVGERNAAVDEAAGRFGAFARRSPGATAGVVGVRDSGGLT